MAIRLSLIAGAALALSGCASFAGMQEPVVSPLEATNLIRDGYSLKTSLERIASDDLDEEPAVYRNRVLSIWLLAIDTRYDGFRRDLSRARKYGNVGLDTLSLGLTSAASVIGGAAKELSAVATGVGGVRASLDRELYFEKTLPVLISYMDAERLTLRGRILQGMARPIEEYSLEQGFSDLWLYQGAGSLDRALGKAADDAGKAVSDAERDYSAATDLCLPAEDAAAQRRILSRRVLADIDNADATKRSTARGHLATAAQQSGLADAAAATDDAERDRQARAALDHILTLCSKKELGEFENAVFPGGNDG